MNCSISKVQYILLNNYNHFRKKNCIVAIVILLQAISISSDHIDWIYETNTSKLSFALLIYVYNIINFASRRWMKLWSC